MSDTQRTLFLVIFLCISCKDVSKMDNSKNNRASSIDIKSSCVESYEEQHDYKDQKNEDERRRKDSSREGRDRDFYESLLQGRGTDSIYICPSRGAMLYSYKHDNVNSPHLQKIDSIHFWRWNSNPDPIGNLFGGDRDTIDQNSFRQKLGILYGFPNDYKNIDSVAAVTIAATAAAECYGSEMTPFKTRLMGDNKEHWMVYCFPTIPDNIDEQEYCYCMRIRQYKDGMVFNSPLGSTICPVVFVVLISRENGRVLASDIRFR
jgi:ferredoxin-thioredoxin reductase catalytic subunit